MRRHIGVFAAILVFAAALAVPAAQAARHMLVGMQDDAMALRGNPDFTFGTMKQLRVQIVRINLNWPDVHAMLRGILTLDGQERLAGVLRGDWSGKNRQTGATELQFDNGTFRFDAPVALPIQH